jgi:hypothetical protein
MGDQTNLGRQVLLNCNSSISTGCGSVRAEPGHSAQAIAVTRWFLPLAGHFRTLGWNAAVPAAVRRPSSPRSKGESPLGQPGSMS